MSMGNFEYALEFVLGHEGGFANFKEDPGGMTMFGITKRVYDEYYGADANEDKCGTCLSRGQKKYI